jgi:hypothetical protein
MTKNILFNVTVKDREYSFEGERLWIGSAASRARRPDQVVSSI